MKFTFLGATHEVTGSCTYIEACGKKFLIDRGMEQGRDVYENMPLPVSASQIDFVLITHAHIDHTGLLPQLFAQGFRGSVHLTRATANLCDIMLRDSAHIQEFEAEWRNRKGKREGKPPFIPLYTMDDAIGVISLLVPHDYDVKTTPAEGIEVRFTDAGHLLGSSSVELWLTEDGETRKTVFSGDIGNINQPLIRDPQYVDSADYVVMESTYGDRLHDAPPDYAAELAKVLQRTFDRRGSVIIPSFAVGRTQELLYFLREIKEKDMVKGHEGFTVYVDSPLAIEATTIFKNNAMWCYDEEAKGYVDNGINPIFFDDLKVSVTSADSIAINTDASSKVIISSSGMCEAGRIKHHLKHNLWKRENSVVFAGYQAVNTLGRALVEGAEKVKIFGEDINVAAEIIQLPGISGHADKNKLIDWITHFSPKPRLVFVNHGESEVADSFAALLKNEHDIPSYAPYSGAIFDAAAGKVIFDAQPIALKPKETAAKNPALDRLVSAGERLLKALKASGGRANKDMARLADQINSLCDKWVK